VHTTTGYHKPGILFHAL